MIVHCLECGREIECVTLAKKKCFVCRQKEKKESGRRWFFAQSHSTSQEIKNKSPQIRLVCTSCHRTTIFNHPILSIEWAKIFANYFPQCALRNEWENRDDDGALSKDGHPTENGTYLCYKCQKYEKLPIHLPLRSKKIRHF